MVEGQEMTVDSREWIAAPKQGSVVLHARCTYCGNSGLRLMRTYQVQSSSDRPDMNVREVSTDNGAIWGGRQELDACQEIPGGVMRYYQGSPFLDSSSGLLIDIRTEAFYPENDVAGSFAYRRSSYRVATAEGDAFSSSQPIVQHGGSPSDPPPL